MKRILAAFGLAATALIFAGQVAATPIFVAPFGNDGPGTGLQDVINGITVSTPTCPSAPCTSSVDVNTDQFQPSSHWSISGSGGSFSQVIAAIAGLAPQNIFGIYDVTNPLNKAILFVGGTTGAQALLTIGVGGQVTVNFVNTGVILGSGNLFGYYLQTPNGTFYSDPSLNFDGMSPHMVAYQGQGTDTIQVGGSSPGIWGSNEFILGWEDTAAPGWDQDYQDFVAIVESVNPVPEPSAIALFGLGLLVLGFAASLRRRHPGS